MVSGIAYVFYGICVHDWSCSVEFTNYGGPHWCIDNHRWFNYLSDFAVNWPEARRIGFHVKILAASDTGILLRNTLHLMSSLYLYR